MKDEWGEEVSWTEPKLASRVMPLKKDELELHIDVKEFQGSERLDIRLWAKVDGKMRPTQKGVVIFPQQYKQFLALVTEVINGVSSK